MDIIGICEDCLVLVANGGDATEAQKKGLAAIAAEGYRVEAGADDRYFSKAACDVCGYELAGDRYEAALVPARVYS